MKVQTMSICVGDGRCNAHCPFCVARMTGKPKRRTQGINLVNLRSACLLAKKAETTTVLLTGKGEPTMQPEEIEQYLDFLRPYEFPLIEMQTNGIRLPAMDSDLLTGWLKKGLTHIALSTVDVENVPNREIYSYHYPDLEENCRRLRALGYTVRLCVMLMHPYVHRPADVCRLIDACREWGVDQITIRPIKCPEESRDETVTKFTREHTLTDDELGKIASFLDERGKKLLPLYHGAQIYEVGGQNVCLSDCLTLDRSTDEIRSLIFYSNGRLTYSWDHPGAVILSGWQED